MLHVSLRAELRSGAVALPPSIGLSAIERQVVSLSFQDRLVTVMPASRLQRLLYHVFGTRPANRLADPRLEMLRVFCVHYRVEGHAAFFRMSSPAASVGLFSQSLLAAVLLIDSLNRFKRGKT